jgi:hypothetical protein
MFARYRARMGRLSEMSDRQLADIGVRRPELPAERAWFPDLFASYGPADLFRTSDPRPTPSGRRR